MGDMNEMTTDHVGVVARACTMAATSQIAVRNRAHAGTPAATTGEFRLVTGPFAAIDDVFTPFPGTGVPGGPSA